jgi:hypothetical protein
LTVPECGPGNAGGVVGHGWDRLLAKRHGRPPDKKAIQRAWTSYPPSSV